MDSERVEAHDDFGRSPNLSIELYKLITQSGYVNKNLLSGLVKHGTKIGHVTYDQVNSLLKKEYQDSADPVIDTTLDNLIQYLNFKGIDIVDETVRSQDKSAQKCMFPNQIYNRDIGIIDILDSKTQKELGKEIFVFKRQLVNVLCSSEFSDCFIRELHGAYWEAISEKNAKRLKKGGASPIHKKNLGRQTSKDTDKQIPEHNYTNEQIRECLDTIGRIDERVNSLYLALKQSKSKGECEEIEKRIQFKKNSRQRILSSFDYKHEVINKAVVYLNKNKKGRNKRMISLINSLHKKYKNPLDLLVASNLRLVRHYAKKYLRNSLYDELVQEGNDGLIEAANDFDYRRGCAFSTYATWWIRQKISRYFQDNRWVVRIPNHIHEMHTHIKRAIEEYEIKHGCEPSKDILASAVGISVSELHRVIRCMKAPISIDKLINPDDDTDMSAFIPDPSSENPVREMEKTMLRERIEKVLDKTLTVREKEIIKLRFGIGKECSYTLEEVGKIFNVSRERIRQLEAKSIRKLRNPCVHGSLELGFKPKLHKRQV